MPCELVYLPSVCWSAQVWSEWFGAGLRIGAPLVLLLVGVGFGCFIVGWSVLFVSLWSLWLIWYCLHYRAVLVVVAF